MKNSLPFYGRGAQLQELRWLYGRKRSTIIEGPPGIGKTALLGQFRESCSCFVCDRPTTLLGLCESLERQLGSGCNDGVSVIQRKNRLLETIADRATLLILDQAENISPRAARFIDLLARRLPLWVACRNTSPAQVGHLWQYLPDFWHVRVPPLSPQETNAFLQAAVQQGHIQTDAPDHTIELHRLSQGNPRTLEKILEELTARPYPLHSSHGKRLLALDLRIHQMPLRGTLPKHP